MKPTKNQIPVLLKGWELAESHHCYNDVQKSSDKQESINNSTLMKYVNSQISQVKNIISKIVAYAKIKRIISFNTFQTLKGNSKAEKKEEKSKGIS